MSSALRRIRRTALTAAAAGVRAVGRSRNRDDVGAVLAAAEAVMRKKTYCLLVTEGADGPSARVVQPFRPDRDLTVHLGTSPQSRKAHEIEANGTALLVYQRDRDAACVTLHCDAELLTEERTRRRWFMPMWRAFWPGGPGEDFVVVRCRPRAIEVWDGRRGITPEPFGLRAARLERADLGWRLVEPGQVSS